jgi:hypothetical protein
MDTGVLYGEMAASFLLHLATPFTVGTLLSNFAVGSGTTRTTLLIIVGITVGVSVLIQMGLLTFLQAHSCGGVKNVSGIMAGTLVSAALTAFFSALPVFIEGLRLTISQVLVNHLPIFTPQQFAAYQKILADSVALVKAGGDAAGVQVPAEMEMIKKLGVTPEEYEEQTLKEGMIGMSYMAAFAGAYGIGIGSFKAAKCNPKSVED